MHKAGLLLIGILVLGCSWVQAESPQVLWTQETGATVQHTAVAAELHPDPGLETLVLESATGVLHCLRGNGSNLWIQDTLFEAAAPVPPAVTVQEGKALILVASAEGEIIFLSGSDGNEQWRASETYPNPSALAWADFDGDGSDEAVVGSEKGVCILEQNGAVRWFTDEGQDGTALKVLGPLALGDVDGDFSPEIFGTTESGPFSLSGMGNFFWQRTETGAFGSTLLLGDLNQDNLPELYCVTEKSTIAAFDAAMGTPLWQWVPEEAPSGKLQLALGVRNADGQGSLIVSGGDGYVASLDGNGEAQWKTKIEQGQIYPVTGDVDGEGLIDIVVAGDGFLAALDGEGEVLWKQAQSGTSAGSAVLADINGDYRTDILSMNTKGMVSVVTLGAIHRLDRFPWPMARYNAAGQGAPAFVTDPYLGEAVPEYLEKTPLLRNPSFEYSSSSDTTFPQGWEQAASIDGSVLLQQDTVESGTHALHFKTAGSPLAVQSARMPLDKELVKVEAAVMVQGPSDATAQLNWYGRKGLISSTPLSGNIQPEAWSELYLPETDRPAGALWVCLELSSSAEALWDSGRVEGVYTRIPSAKVFCNQVGYEVNNPKHFTAWSSFIPEKGTFFVIDEKGTVVHESGFGGPGTTITGAYGNEWPGYYWRGDFTSFVKEGRYRLRVQMDDLIVESPMFQLGRNLLFKEVFNSPFDALRAWRTEEGWSDGYGSSMVTHAYTLMFAAEFYGVVQWRYKTLPAGQDAILAELKWGADRLVKYIKDNDGTTPNSDGTFEAAALAKVSRFVKNNTEYISMAKQLLKLSQTFGVKNVNTFRTALDLYIVTQEEEYGKMAAELHPDISLEYPEALVEFESEVTSYMGLSVELGMRLSQTSSALIKQTDNPFGVFTGGTPDQPNFFNTPMDASAVRQGNTASILAVAQLVARAMRFAPDYQYRIFVMDQLNWLMGNNPYGVSLIKGVGSQQAPSFAAGTVDGAALNGFTWEAPGVDRPWFDISGGGIPDEVTNGARIHNSVLYMGVLAHMKRIRMTTTE